MNSTNEEHAAGSKKGERIFDVTVRKNVGGILCLAAEYQLSESQLKTDPCHLYFASDSRYDITIMEGT